jgi:hypothetical protein
MRIRYYRLLLLAVAATVRPATAQTVDHYDMSRVGTRGADGQAAYPSGVIDPSRSNPSQPPTDVAVPLPPQPDTPIRAVPSGYGPSGYSSGPALGPAPPNATGLVNQPYGPASPYNPSYSPGGPYYGPNAQYYGPMVPSSGPAVPSNPQSTQIYPPPAAAQPQSACPLPATWYTRIDYFHWNEKILSMDFVNESGALFTVGYQRQVGIERFRGELFGGVVDYEGFGQFGNGGLDPLASNTGYLGLRGEYELVLAPAAWERHLEFLAGFGSRFWIRDLHDGTADDGSPVFGYQETWWTFYPYLGLQTNSTLSSGLDFYTESRVGATVLTYDFASIGDRPMWPTPGLMANVEIGLRGSCFYAAARAEVMRWEDSPIVQDAYQPRATLYTLGGRFGVMF